MDETSPVYENFSNKMTAMSGRPKLNVTNMKSPFSGGGSIVPKMTPGSKFIPRPSGRGGTIIPPEGLTRRKRRSDAKPFGQVKAEIDLKEERKKSRNVFKMMANLKEKIAINSKKITLLKNILQAKDSYGGKEDPLEETNKTIEEIGKIIEKDYDYRISQEKEENDRLRSDKSKERQDESESKLENVKKVGQKVGKSINEGVSKVTSPIGNIFSGIAESLKFIGFGILANNAFDWLKNEENREKLSNFFKFIASKWKWVLGIGAGLVGLKVLGTIIGIVKTVGTVIGILASPLALKAIAVIAAGVLVYKGGKFLMTQIRGGKDAQEAREKNREKLKESGVMKVVGDRGADVMRDGKKVFVKTEDLTESEKAAVDKFKAEDQRIKDVTKQKNKDIRETFDRVTKERESMDNPEWAKIMAVKDLKKRKKLIKEFRKETQQIVNAEKKSLRKEAKANYSGSTGDISNITPVSTDKNNIDEKVKDITSNTKKDKSLIDKKVDSITPNIKAYSVPSMLNMDLGTEKEVDVAGEINTSGGEINEVEVVNSINRLNDYMLETPKIHQIVG